MHITSRTNPKIKLIRALARRKERAETGLLVIEGLAHIGAALESGTPFEFILSATPLPDTGYAQTILALAEARGIELLTTEPDILVDLAGKDNPQGLLAVARWQATLLASLTAVTHPWLAAAVAPQDPGNVGTLLRTLDAVGASGLLLLDTSVDPTHPTAVRAALGSLFWLPVVQTDFATFAAWAAVQGYQLTGSSARATTDYRHATFQKPAILLLGSERAGLTPEQAAICDPLLRLPMAGRATSLNLSVAAGVLLYAMQAAFDPGPV